MSQEANFGENTAHTDSTQPRPVRGEFSQSVTDAVIADMQARREMGTRKYGVELLTFNGRDALLEVYQELLDATMYTKQLLMERDREKTKGTARPEGGATGDVSPTSGLGRTGSASA